MEYKIGLLLLQSNAYPGIAKDYINGLTLGLGEFADKVKLKTEGIGQGSDAKNTISACQKLVFQEDVSLITGMIGHRGLNEIRDAIGNLETPALLSDLGASLPLQIRQNPWVFTNSFGLCESAFLWGASAPANGVSNVMTSTCYYESGYGVMDALSQGLTNNGGGFSGHFITPLKPRTDEVGQMNLAYNEQKPDAVFAFHSGIFAEEHADFLKDVKDFDASKLYLSPFSVPEKIKENHASLFDGAYCVASWTVDEKNTESVNFVNIYKEKHQKTPSETAMLGYENGMLIKQVLFASSKDNLTTQEVKDRLAQVVSVGPRGRLSFDSIGRTQFDHGIYQLKKTDNGLIFELKKTLKNTFDMKLLIDQPVVSAGWYNAYMCT